MAFEYNAVTSPTLQEIISNASISGLKALATSSLTAFVAYASLLKKQQNVITQYMF